MASKRVAVIGAGPIGLEFALGAIQRGFQVDVFEKADGCAAHMQAYHFVRLFSPWKLNMTVAGVEALKSVGAAVPDSEGVPTGKEYIDEYLTPLCSVVAKSAKMNFNSEVSAVARGALLKSESIGGGDLQMPKNKPLAPNLRRETCFDILVRNAEGVERLEEGFDFVVDCGGVYRPDLASWVGRGGVPAIGERALRGAQRIFGTVPDALGADRDRFAGRRAMLVGTGMSAATSARFISDLAREVPGTSLVWLTRSAGTPFSVIENDVLPQRKALCELGNRAANGELAGVEYIGGSAVRSIVEVEGKLEVTVQTAEGTRIEKVDEFVSNCGFKPDTSIFQELQVHQCYASEGPMKLAATLLGGSGDCLAQVSAGADSLKNPEPGFFVLGHKSYGRNSAFLLKIGHEQITSILDTLAPQAAQAAL